MQAHHDPPNLYAIPENIMGFIHESGPVRPKLPPHLMDEGERAAGLVERATSELLSAVEEVKNMDVVDALNHASDQEVKKDIIRQIRKRLQDNSTRVVYMALELIETVVKSCDISVHKEIGTAKFMATMSFVARYYYGSRSQECIDVSKKALDLIQAWGETKPMALQVPLFEQVYYELMIGRMPFKNQYGVRAPLCMTRGHVRVVFAPPPLAASQQNATHIEQPQGRGDYVFQQQYHA